MPSTKPSTMHSCSADSASAAWRWRSRSSSLSIRKMPRCPPESAGLRTAGSPTVFERPPRPLASERTAANGGCGTPSSANARRITILLRIRWATLGADRRQAEALGHRRDDRHGAVGRDRQRAVDRVAPGHLGDRVDVGEVDRLGDVGDLKPERVGVAVDGDDADALLARLQDRAPLMAPGADEEDGLHTGRCYSALPLSCRRRSSASGKRNETRVPARDLAAVALAQPRPDPAAVVAAGHERRRRAAGDLGADPAARRRREGGRADRPQLPAGGARIGDGAARRIAAERQHLRRRRVGRAVGDPQVDRAGARRRRQSADARRAASKGERGARAMRALQDTPGTPLDSPRGAERQEDPDHRRSRLHRDDARAPARRRERGDRVRQPAPRRALGHRPRRAPELPLRAGRRARPAPA